MYVHVETCGGCDLLAAALLALAALPAVLAEATAAALLARVAHPAVLADALVLAVTRKQWWLVVGG